MSKPTIASPIQLLAAGVLILAGLVLAQQETDQVAVMRIKGAIGPATTDYLVRGMADAEAAGDQAVVILIDTPGGLDAATRDINQAILASKIPVITYVSPEGARAASAGTYIMYASHVAAMAPATNLGAATPVQIIGGGQPDKPAEKDRDKAEGEDGDGEGESEPAPSATDAMSRKAINDSVAYIRGLAEKRGRNADWAEEAVREAASLSASKALEQGVIDLVADSLDDLLDQLDGREIDLGDRTVTLNTADAPIRMLEPDWRNQLLAKITDPTVAYLLFIIGLYGLLLEGYNPGVLVPGIVGGIALILALYAFQVLPINYAGVALILLGLALIVAEAFAPSFGILGIGGIVALVIGSIILIDTDLPGFAVSRSLIAGIAAVSGLAFLGITLAAVKARQRPVVSGAETVFGMTGEVLDGDGRIHVAGEDWLTSSDDPLAPGDRVEVTGRDGLVLKVRKVIKGD